MTCGLLVLTASALHFMVFPTSDDARQADAVVILAGSPEERLPLAVRLAEQGRGVLVVSAAGGEVNAPARALCEDPPAEVRTVCFEPASPNTRAEARAIGDLATDEGWDQVAVVTSSYHLMRAGMLIRRCTDAEVSMVEARPLIDGLQWARFVVTEVGGLATGMVSRSC
jgi:uncharacterized SAM-binding protein YcdF (DUF218 family)